MQGFVFIYNNERKVATRVYEIWWHVLSTEFGTLSSPRAFHWLGFLGI